MWSKNLPETAKQKKKKQVKDLGRNVEISSSYYACITPRSGSILKNVETSLKCPHEDVGKVASAGISISNGEFLP